MSLLMLLAASALAAPGDRVGVVISARVGPDIPAFSPLKVFVLPGLEIGYAPGDGPVEIFVLGSYAVPLASGGGEDPGLDQAYNYDLFQRQVSIGLGARLRLRDALGPLSVTGALGPKLDLLETVTRGEKEDGTYFGENRERYTTGGFHVSPGLELPVGPGAFLFEASFSWSPLTKVITGKSNTGRIVPQLGYRFMF